MNIALSHNSTTIRINSDLIAFVFDDGVGVYVSLCIEPINIRQLGGALVDIIADPAAGYGTTTILVGDTYASIKAALAGFAELAHPTFTNILINADKVARILDNGSERELIFDTYNRCISSDTASDIATAIANALAGSGAVPSSRTLTINGVTYDLSADRTWTVTASDPTKVPYTGATGDVDLNSYSLNAKSLHVKGTGGAGHLGLKHQSAPITASTSESTLGADSSGNPVWKNDGNAIQNIMLENAAITGATKTKITYDSKGRVTSGADATTADIADSTNKRYVTDAQLTVIGNTSGTNTGDQTSIVGISGTKAQFDTACSEGNFVYTGDGINAGSNNILTSGQVGIGGITPATNNQLEISADVNTAVGIDITAHTADTISGNLYIGKSRGTHASPTAVQSGDRLGFIALRGYDGLNYQSAVTIVGTADETFSNGTGSRGGGLQIETCTTGGSSPVRTARLKLHATGNLSVGSSLTDNGYRLEVTGNSRIQGSSTSSGNALIVSDSAADPILTLTNTGAAQFRAIASPATPSAGDGTIFIDSTAKALFIKDDAGIYKGQINNAAIASQGAGFATDTYVTNSDLIIPSFNLQAKAVFLWKISASKTGAGTQTPIYNIRIGANRTTGDTARLTLTGPAQTAVADIGTLWIMVTLRSVGAGASDTVLQGTAWWNHQGTAANTTTQGTGFANNGTGHVQATSAGFSNTGLAGQYVGLSINGGTSASWTITQVVGELTY